jgi:hypothetical protein
MYQSGLAGKASEPRWPPPVISPRKPLPARLGQAVELILSDRDMLKELATRLQ